jgi:predicted HicB family RNase H-like nuclease
MLLRLPKGLKASIEQAAAAANQSANTWVMRCVERCVSEAVGR